MSLEQYKITTVTGARVLKCSNYFCFWLKKDSIDSRTIKNLTDRMSSSLILIFRNYGKKIISNSRSILLTIYGCYGDILRSIFIEFEHFFVKKQYFEKWLWLCYVVLFMWLKSYFSIDNETKILKWAVNDSSV